MARSIAIIQKEIIDEKEKTAELQTLTSTSKTSIWRLWTRVTATAIWTLETLFDLHKKEVDQALLVKKPHNLYWYKKKAEAFQYGKMLKLDSDVYDNTGVDPDEIAKSRIVKQVAVVETQGCVRIKAAKEVNGELQKLSQKSATQEEASPNEQNNAPYELEALNYYMQQIKDAGVKLLVNSSDPDSLKLEIDIYYDPMVLDSQGGRLDGNSVKPVENTIRTYLRNLPFNGEFVLATLTDRLQETPGVIIPQIVRAAAKYGQQKYKEIRVRYLPDAGYLRVNDENALTINYTPYNNDDTIQSHTTSVQTRL